MLVTDPLHPTAVQGAFDPTTNTGVVPLPACSPNGATVGPHDNIMLGCTPGNNPSDTQTLVINARTKQSVSTNGITGSDEVFYNRGDNRYYLGASRNPGQAKLGVVSGRTNFFIEGIPQSTGSHSVATDSKRNLISFRKSPPPRWSDQAATPRRSVRESAAARADVLRSTSMISMTMMTTVMITITITTRGLASAATTR